MNNPNMNNKASFSELTIGEVVQALKRYQPFIAAVAAVVLLVTFVPGKPKQNTTQGLSTLSTTPGANSSVTGPAGAAASAPPGSVGITQGYYFFNAAPYILTLLIMIAAIPDEHGTIIRVRLA